MLFLDGVGLGKDDPALNPFCVARLPTLCSLLNGDPPLLRTRDFSSRAATMVPLDANLGVEGLPQSGTGQTALFTGVNGARVIGKHFGPYPYSTLKPAIHERNIFKRLRAAGKTSLFANAFPQRFFDYMNQRRSRLTVTTLACTMTGIPLMNHRDLQEGRGISADITNVGWREMGYDIPVIPPEEAGRRLARLSAQHDFVLFEYWMTDHAGHSENFSRAVDVLERFDGMLSGVLDELDPKNTVLFLTSDHGNIEDMSTKSHTRNPVPALLYGRSHDAVAAKLRSGSPASADLTHVTPTLMHVLTHGGPD